MISLPDHIPDLRRLNVFRAVVMMMIATIGLRLWYLQLVREPELTAMSQAQSVRTIRRVAPRGAIVDTRGRVIATNRFKFVVSISPDDAKKHPETLDSLAPLLKTDVETLKAKVFPVTVNKAGKVIQLNHPYDPVPLDRDIGIEVLSQIEEQHLNLPGVLVTRDPVRYYKDGIVCSHILGYTGLISEDQLSNADDSYHGGDFVGKAGLEAHYEQELRGIDGGDNFTVDARGRMLRKLGEKKPQAGHTLKLAMDLDLQRKAYELLKDQYDGKNRLHPGSHTGAIVAMNPNNGEVLAMVSMPGYDANRYTADYTRNYNNPSKPLINRATGAALPSGSPFKLVTAAAGLETGKLSQWTTHTCNGSMRLGRGATFHCDEVHGTIAFEKAIGASCNVYFYNVGQSVGPQTLADWADRFGLGKRTGIDISELAGRVPSPARRKAHAKKGQDGNWYPGETLNMAIGQGDLRITPLQLANYVSALANGGTLWKPRMVHAIIDPTAPTDQQEQVLQPEANGKLGLRPENRALIVSGMRHAVAPGGTAAGIAIPGLDIAGKTGTVEIANTRQRNSMFVCFAPADHPKIALAVMVEGGGFGAQTAAPIAQQLLATYFHIKVGPITYGSAND